MGLGLDEAKIAFSAKYPVTEEMLRNVKPWLKKNIT